MADLPDQKGWRIKGDAGYGPLSTFARGKVDIGKIRRNWEDILRVVASIYTGTVRAYDVVTMLQRDGHPTALGEAIAMYGRIFKSLHILSYIDVDETYRRDIKGIRNLQEGRHALARKICHGKKGELYHRYERGLEDSFSEANPALTSENPKLSAERPGQRLQRTGSPSGGQTRRRGRARASTHGKAGPLWFSCLSWLPPSMPASVSLPPEHGLAPLLRGPAWPARPAGANPPPGTRQCSNARTSPSSGCTSTVTASPKPGTAWYASRTGPSSTSAAPAAATAP